MEKINNIDLLNETNFPSDLKNLDGEQLTELSAQLRQFIIDAASNNPGHLGANLGVVELTVALHKVFNTPEDKIIWDVGHQAYAHKILTGRRDVFHTNRKYGGISGFPKVTESQYDAFGVGHSSTAISAALGIGTAAKLLGEKRQVVAVVGDASLAGGMAMEALNHGGVAKTDILVILNDNNMAIDQNVGALKEYLVNITTSQTYNKLKKDVWNFMGKLGRSRAVIQRVDNAVKSMLLQHGNLFEALGFRYFGPVDGHDVNHLVRILQDTKAIEGPKLLHVITLKGKGYYFAEKDQTRWHAPGLFNKETGEILSATSPKTTLIQDVFGHTLTALAEDNQRIVGITPAMATGCSMHIPMSRFPDRFFDVGIAEQHAMTFAAGLAISGFTPFCNIYSSFLQRGYDQVIHDVALQKLPVVLCIDRAGISGEDGPTHHGAYDLAYLRCVPNVIISAPMNEIELRNLMYTAQLEPSIPFAIRYPRGRGVIENWDVPFEKIQIGKGRILSEDENADIAIVSIGWAGNMALEACNLLRSEKIEVSHYDMRFLKPIDEAILHHICMKYKKIVTVEDGTIVGGLGSSVLEFISDNGYSVQVKRLGIPDKFITHGTMQELHKVCGYDAIGIQETVKEMISKNAKMH
jgi:1-deoxy-D-xylulose-5-phosphate synthase